MTRPRFTVAALMGVVFYFAIGLAALRSNSIWWGVGLSAAAVLTMSSAAVLAIAKSGQARVIWAGFAIFGWAYLLMGFPTTLSNSELRPLAVALIPFEMIHPYISLDKSLNKPWSAKLGYYWVCHSLLVLIFGFAGAGLGWAVSGRRERSSSLQDEHADA